MIYFSNILINFALEFIQSFINYIFEIENNYLIIKYLIILIIR